MEEIFNFKNDQDDYYAILGCDETASMEQISAEFKIRALETHPDKRPNDESADAEFKRLHTAKETLSDPETRKLYDKWRCAGLAMSFEQWSSLSKNVHTSMHWATRAKKDLMLEAGQDKSKVAAEGSQEIRTNVPLWDREPPSESLRKFRNYEI